MFLRGRGSVASAHYGAVTHQSGALGMLQGDAIRNITGSFAVRTNTNGYSGALFPAGPFNDIDIGGDGRLSFLAGFDASRVAPVANENRPVNRAVVYLVRAR